jgi:hypothetical protein
MSDLEDFINPIPTKESAIRVALDPGDLSGQNEGKKAKDAASKAAKIQEEAELTGIGEQRRQFDITQESFRPFQEAGVAAIGQQQALLGLSGDEAQQSAFDQFNQSPGQQFLRNRAQKNLLRNSAAIGGLGGGNVRSALVQQGVGFAQQDFNNQFGRLGQLAGQGQAATQSVGQFGQNATNNIQQGINQAGQARASGILGRQQASAQQQQQLLQTGATALSFFSDPKLKTNKKVIGEKSGHKIWSWTWNELAESIGLSGNDRGVMADEVKRINPDAVSVRDGFMVVNYEMIGV